ncbi:MAG TPA: 4Fe-4S binding protein [Candidatus Moranbacteria bacterium]|mgnify:CR=1 FL=1|nr:4Fe-4S binding protein [Candidatus Moranbacteria bacterium]
MEEGAIIQHDIKKAPKTGNWRYMKPEVDKEKCIGCATCVPFCPEAAIEMKRGQGQKKAKADIDYEYCKGCGVCAEVCPVKAIFMKK